MFSIERSIDFGGVRRATGLPLPISVRDAANKAYGDQILMGLGDNLFATLALNFKGTRSVPSNVSMVRSTPGEVSNNFGALESVSANLGRITTYGSSLGCDGLLCEPSSTNYHKYSDVFSGTGWSNSAAGETLYITPGAVSGRDSVGLNLVTEDSGTAVFRTKYGTITGVSQGARTSFTLEARPYLLGGGRNILLYFSGPAFLGQRIGACFDCLTGEVLGLQGTTQQTVDVVAEPIVFTDGVGGWRFSISATTQAAANVLAGYSPSVGTTNAYTSDGRPCFYVGKAQVELGSPTSYIGTSGAVATRGGDVANCALDGRHLASGRGIVLVRFSKRTPVGTGESPHVLTLSDGTTTNRVALKLSRGATAPEVNVSASVTTGGVDSLIPGTVVGLGVIKAALAWGPAGAAMYVGGSQVWATSSALVGPASLSNLALGHDGQGANQLGGAIAMAALFPYASLSVDQLEGLTL